MFFKINFYVIVHFYLAHPVCHLFRSYYMFCRFWYNTIFAVITKKQYYSYCCFDYFNDVK